MEIIFLSFRTLERRKCARAISELQKLCIGVKCV
jgi:hypothetical protein